MSITDNPISVQLDGESFTVPDEDTILIKATIQGSALQINGVDMAGEETGLVETVVVGGDTIEPRSGTAHIGGFVL